MTTDREWIPEHWMLPFLDLLSCGRDRVRELMNDKTLVQINAPLALMAVSTKAEIGLLTRLRKGGMLTLPVAR